MVWLRDSFDFRGMVASINLIRFLYYGSHLIGKNLIFNGLGLICIIDLHQYDFSKLLQFYFQEITITKK